MTPGERSPRTAPPSSRESIPALQRECAARWQLTLESACSDAGPSRVLRARLADGTPVVLKLSPAPGLADEARALAHWNGGGAVRLLASDLARGALLLERAEPGAPLASLCAQADRAATAEAAHLMQELHRPTAETTGPPELSEWVDALEETRLATTPPALRQAGIEALRAGRELLAHSDSAFVLHGDLHHHNILSARRAPWLAIDPKGVIGPREADAAALLRNPPSYVLSCAFPEHLMRERIRLIAEITGLDPDPMRLWGWVLAVVAAWWSFEDSEADWPQWLACAEAIQRSA